MSWFPLASRRSIPLGFVGMLALVWTFESFLTRHDLRFSGVEADTWKAARFATDHIAAGGVLMLGDSQVEMGISPLTLESHLGQPVQCLAVPGGQAPSSYFLLRRALRAGMLPSAVVVDFEPHLLQHDRGPGQKMWPEMADLDECLDLALTMGNAGEFGSMAVARILPSYRERMEIRANLMAGLRGETPILPDQMVMARRNRGMNRGALIMAKQSAGHEHDFSNWGDTGPWATNPLNETYVHRFMLLAQEHNLPVFVVLMPVVPGLEEKSMRTGLESAYYYWLSAVQGLYPNLFVLDWRHASYPESVFVDALHLDVDGSTSVAIALADHLKRCMHGEGINQRWVHMPQFKLDESQVALEDHNQSDALIRSSGVIRR